eukprot:TRINITY_DN11779_c0_g1_i1.p1 TRINITY_DN11779_c0_g1~~TRINITY_DN11779_c0_g1_i1.p1  ORF type:complete len:274 (+),score=77.69 TRINITY_DN11779_c0_g1_i1:59-880(+)
MSRALSFVICTCLCAFVCAQQAPPFNFSEYFVGDWDITRSTINMKTYETVVEEQRGHYAIQKENNTLNLVGVSFDNDTATGEHLNEQEIFIELSSATSGVFKSGPEDPLRTIFSFDFTQLNHVQVATGEYFITEQKTAIYQFVFSSFDRFTLTIIPKNITEESEMIVWAGKKIPIPVEKSFFQKYGMLLMIGGYMIFMFISQKKQMDNTRQDATRTTQRIVQAVKAEKDKEGKETKESKKDSESSDAEVVTPGAKAAEEVETTEKSTKSKKTD